MQASARIIRFIEAHEGVALEAYRDVAGVWTIGAGLTAKSGVVDPSPGLRITAGEASELLAAALTRTYEPAVRRALRGCAQHEFDAALSFHFNTGAIARASWVTWFKRRPRDDEEVRRRLGLWNKATVGDALKPLSGLARRRAEEADILLLNKWPEGL